MEDDKCVVFKFDNAWSVIIEILCFLWILIVEIIDFEWDFEFLISKILLGFFILWLAIWLRFILNIIVCSSKECIKLYKDYLVIFNWNYLFKIVEKRIEYIDIERITIKHEAFDGISIKQKNKKKELSFVMSKQSLKEIKNILIEKWLPVVEKTK